MNYWSTSLYTYGTLYVETEPQRQWSPQHGTWGKDFSTGSYLPISSNNGRQQTEWLPNPRFADAPHSPCAPPVPSNFGGRPKNPDLQSYMDKKVYRRTTTSTTNPTGKPVCRMHVNPLDCNERCDLKAAPGAIGGFRYYCHHHKPTAETWYNEQQN